MHIKQVIIRGFKTYKEQTALDEDFSPGTNVVVGFNGSGKSNFFQAILFVLSDQYSSLRAETRKALLHEGAGQAVLTAYVEVILDNTDRRVPIESDQVSIRRLIGVKKDDWLLDGKHSTKAEIFGLLEGAGFAKTSPYYIVQQGKVSELTLMTDVQRLGLLQDISGAGVYDDRRAESVRIMEDTMMRQTRMRELIGEIEQRLATLEGEQRELRECERLESKKRTLEYVIADREWRSAQERIDELEVRRKEASERLIKFQGSVGDIRKRKADAEAEFQRREEEQRTTSERLAGIEAASSRTFEALAKARLEAEEEARRQNEGEERGAARLKELERARAELATAAQEVQEARPRSEAAEKAHRELDRRHQVANTQREQLLAKQGRRQQYASVEERNEALGEEVRRQTTQLKQHRRGMGECDERLRKVQERRSQATEEVAKQHEGLTGTEQRLGVLIRESRSLGEQLEQGSERVRSLHQDREQANRRVAKHLEEAQRFRNRLEGTMPRGYRQAIPQVMRWVNQNGLSDRIRGPLLYHIEVAAPFRTAVESYAGTALFNVLAMDDEIAAQAVKLVRSRNLGAVVITPLNQISYKEQRYPNIKDTKPLVEVIKCPDWVKPAVHQIFGKALVCHNMELCQEAKRHGFDGITLGGDRVSRKGVVSGGYQDPRNFVRLALAEDLKAAEAKMDEAEQKLPTIENQIRNSSEEMEKLHSDRRGCQERRRQVQGEADNFRARVRELEATVTKSDRDAEDLRKWRHNMEVMIGEIEASIQAKKSEMHTKTLSGLTAKDEEDLAKLTEEVKKLGTEREKSLRQSRELYAQLAEKEARLESFHRKRVHELEAEAARSSGDAVSERAEEASQVRDRLEREHREAKDGVDACRKELQAIETACADCKSLKETLAAEELKEQEQAGHLHVRVDQLAAEVTAQKQKKAEVDTRLRSLAAPQADVERCRQLQKPQLVRELAEASRVLQGFQHVNRKAVEQFENFSEQLADLRRRKEAIDAAEAAIKGALERIDTQKEATLLQTLRRVNEHFQQVFSELVPGGMGKLRVVRQNESQEDGTGETPASSTDGPEGNAAAVLGGLHGVRIEVSFTGQAQSFLLMNQLSGGQKTVVALSLIFGIQRLEPAPFYLLDEVDAALDASYRSALANLIAKTARSSQVIYTTFRPEVLDKADRCYRVYQQNRVSRIDVITRDQAKQVLREQDRLQGASQAGA
mmetsp:Transcript_29228/g.51119  ORF Transcript_29228/g.51119 Transcript_29228/m.51119 type:complete len:1213 (-) Transcript_29228:46-3684(-)